MLSIQALHKTYANGVKALDGLSLDIPRGMFGLLGPNGAGKSTLMRTLATLQEPDNGSIRFEDVDVLIDKHQLKQRLGYLPQDFGVYRRISCTALLEHLAILKGVLDKPRRDAEIEYVLRRVDLWDVRHRALHSYSGGMRQRFGIAQALLGNPRLIIVDEPTSGLDPEQRTLCLHLLSEFARDAVVILSTHIVEDVADLCERMAIVASGKVIFTGSPQQAAAALEGSIWRGIIPTGVATSYPSGAEQLSSRPVVGGEEVRVFCAQQPHGDLRRTEPALKDVYFLELKRAAQASQHATG